MELFSQIEMTTTKFVVFVLCLIMLNLTFKSSANRSPSSSTARTVSIEESTTTTHHPTTTGKHQKSYESEDEEKFMEMIEDAMNNPKSYYINCLRSKMKLPYTSLENMTTLEW